MKFSIVVCVYNQEKLIRQCVDALLDQKTRDFELIIVDDRSTDNTLQILSEIPDARLKVIQNEKNSRPGYARNRGIEQSCGEYILFVDSDCIVDKNWAEEIILPFALDAAIAVVSGKTMDPPSRTYWELLNEGLNFIALKDGYVKESHTCNMAVRGSFMRQNFFDETLPFSEDLDLCLGCFKKEFKIYYTSKAVLFHHHRSTFWSTFRSYFNWGLYNTVVRLKWRMFPFKDNGIFILLASLICLLSGFWYIPVVLAFVYLAFLYFRSIFMGPKNFLKLAPGQILIKLATAIGYLLGPLAFLRWVYKRKLKSST